MPEKKKLGEMLIEAGIIDSLQLDSALGHQKNWGGKIGSILIELGFISEADLAKFIEKQLNIPCVEIISLNITEKEIEAVKVETAKKYTIFPLKVEGNILNLAMVDPTDLRVIDELQFITGKSIKPSLALESEIKKAIRKHYEGEDIGIRQFKPGPRKMEIAETPTASAPPGEPVFVQEDFVIQEERLKEPPKAKPATDLPKKEEKKEIPNKIILDALASLLIEKGIIKREEFLERIKKRLKGE